ncbi:MAG TPA: LL-diaminopimelate aminotransferase [Actinomycetota bacterium]|jgi:LL-diaminopimelate aminotransferase|nr:LL-diaminopimelate aminotransferase [Actinomycetota bacterium]
MTRGRDRERLRVTDVARRIQALPPYVFAELDRKIKEKAAAGIDVISLGIGDPDQPTPRHVVDAAKEAADDPSTHRYPSYTGMPEFRQTVAEWYLKRFGVELDPDTEVQPLIGSKEGLGHLSLAFVDPGDEALVPDPGYPVYGVGTMLAGGTPVPLPLDVDRGWLPDLSQTAASARTKLLWLNYPSNPTAGVAEVSFFEEAVAFAREHGLLLAHDAAYTELTYDGFTAPSALQVEGAKDVAVEFGSVSKTHNMTGWRVGWVVGSATAVEALAALKTNWDSGIWNAVQRAAIAALTGPQDHVEELRETYARRRDLVVGTLNTLGWSLKAPKGSIYVWLPTRDGMSSAAFAELLVERARVVVSPGSGYGAAGEGYARISLTVPDDRLAEAMDRVREALS